MGGKHLRIHPHLTVTPKPMRAVGRLLWLGARGARRQVPWAAASAPHARAMSGGETPAQREIRQRREERMRGGDGVEPPPTTGASTHAFQADTQKLLDIVASSLYSDKEVFVREIVSNASDACEKLRYAQLTNGAVAQPEEPLQIEVETDVVEGTFTIRDSGIGMSEEELVRNLGTIAQSGSKAFMASVAGEEGADESGRAASSSIIGQFGVGFYSTFMVGTEVEVTSHPAALDEAGQPQRGTQWRSSGGGEFEVAPAAGAPRRGTSIKVTLRDDCRQFASADVVRDILKRHSNFVSFPLLLNGERVNTVDALWTRQPTDVSEDEHAAFYRYVSESWDSPRYTLHYSTDAPVQLRALLYVPTTQSEKFGMGRDSSGLSLYARKVLVLERTPKLLPPWLRFVKGVVDSEDVPLNLSRELLQDSALVAKFNAVLSARVVKHLAEQARRDPAKYLEFYGEFGNNLREGAVNDQANRAEILKLMRFESSALEAGEVTSLPEYAARAAEASPDATSRRVHYLVAPSRAVAEASPFMDAARAAGAEVLFCYDAVDDVVLTSVGSFDGAKFVSVEAADAFEGGPNVAAAPDALAEEQQAALFEWLQSELGEARLAGVRASTRLASHPAVIDDDGHGQVRRMMRQIDKGRVGELPPQRLEVNAGHPLVRRLATLRTEQPELAALLAQQMFDTALVLSGLMDDPREMVPRVLKLMEAAAGCQQ